MIRDGGRQGTLVTDANELVEIRSGAYHDSVTLMRAGRRLAERPGVSAALTAMATALNIDLLTEMGFTPPPGARPDDLVVAIRADDPAALEAARAAVEDLLANRSAPRAFGEPPPARTTGSAARRAGNATVALVSVPGQYAFAEAVDALDAGLNVMIFSDNVPVEHELELKETAARRGLLVMGPDCGTAVVGGVGLGFANVVRPGRIGLVAASGTGAQQVMSLLDEAGEGVSHVLGVGGRDLSAEISGRSTLQALRALDADPVTELIVVVSKPPAPEVGDLIRSAARRLATPVRFGLLGDGGDLTDVVADALGAVGVPVPAWPSWLPSRRVHPPRAGLLRGLFAGGTLCEEAALIAGTTPHEMTDLGDDRYTRGRAHPMIDPTLRLDRLAAETTGDTAAVVLIDVVLGHGAEPDPAAALVPLIQAAAIPVVVSLCGTSGDPQGRDRQAEALAAAGAAVFSSSAEAARHAVALAEGA
ncbi:FdrA family protein [Actinomadura sp. DC4]|uniref:FdrA family protein n=1 Tax=Actinomadura sp. DC4 TaxID=3055069 RepID=UPI0025B0749E|nr:FdrA family protein [Actinomadura sp. DC4]MDN3358360.1 FdrA family protein [Actinomadura sp. DC4]